LKRKKLSLDCFDGNETGFKKLLLKNNSNYLDNSKKNFEEMKDSKMDPKNMCGKDPY